MIGPQFEEATGVVLMVGRFTCACGNTIDVEGVEPTRFGHHVWCKVCGKTSELGH
jgi:hypothetical protein